MFKVGYAERILEVPLFTEMYGYGPFAGRRSLGVRDPLYCRAATFNDGKWRNMIIYTDTCTTCELQARTMRVELASKLGMRPDGIMFIATHTHSAPFLQMQTECSVGWGEPLPEFQEIWKAAVRKVAFDAVHNEEPVTAEAGRAPLSQKLAANRVHKDTDETDPDIRWVRFIRKDGSVKLLMHNHGIHGIAAGPSMKCSADWMGEANRLIVERKLADHPLFLQSAAGDVNTVTCWKSPDPAISEIGSRYVADLEKSIAAGGKKIEVTPVQAAFKTIELPTIQQTAEELRAEAENPVVKEKMPEHAKRIFELAILVERDGELRSFKDMQVLRMGEITIYVFPGEPFVSSGKQIMNASPSPFPMVATVANGNGAYFAPKEIFDEHPKIDSDKSWGFFGFYEIYCYPSQMRMKYRSDVADVVINELLNMKPG
ncbi:MAG: hypothetical protein NT118_12930 [Lentisphaerae bacterium]|nr:hypothetical protein [Lentisphaerota bacterium]